MADTDIQIAACDVSFGTVAGNIGEVISLGKLTADGLTFSLDDNKTEIFTAQDGTTPVNRINTGRTVSVTLTMAETNLEELSKIFKGTMTFATNKVTIEEAIGTLDSDMWDELVLHPSHLPTSNQSQDVTFPRAAPAANFAQVHKYDEIKGWSLTFNIYKDDSSTPKFVEIGGPSS